MAHPLRAYRKKHRLTQAQLAKRLRVSRALIGLIETGDRDVDPRNAVEWERETGIPRAELCPTVFQVSA